MWKCPPPRGGALSVKNLSGKGSRRLLWFFSDCEDNPDFSHLQAPCFFRAAYSRLTSLSGKANLWKSSSWSVLTKMSLLMQNILCHVWYQVLKLQYFLVRCDGPDFPALFQFLLIYNNGPGLYVLPDPSRASQPTAPRVPSSRTGCNQSSLQKPRKLLACINILSRMWSGCMAVWLLQVPQWGLQALSLLTGMWVASLTEGTHLVALL